MGRLFIGIAVKGQILNIISGLFYHKCCLFALQMTSSEAFTETLVANGVTNIFGIVGSAFMDALDIFPAAGVRFVSVQHEQNAVHMADGYAR